MGLTLSRVLLLPFFAARRPFDSVPDELLILIFEALGNIPSAPPPFAVACVSRRWNAVARSTPGLWAGITLHGQKQMASLDKLLALSGAVSISLDLDVAGEVTYPGTECPPSVLGTVVDCLRRNMHRTARLQLRYYPAQASSVDHAFRIDAPILEELVLMCGGMLRSELLCAPLLRRLEIDRMQVSRFSFTAHPHLSELALKDVQVDMSDLYDILSTAPQLRDLSFRDVSFMDDFTTAPLPQEAYDAPIWHHAALRQLTVKNPYGRPLWPILADFLRKLDLASLARLEVALEPYSRVLCGEAEALCAVLRPQAIRVTRNAKKIWRVEFDGEHKVFTFPQRVGGPVISHILNGAAGTLRRLEADAAFCDQLCRREHDLPFFPRFDEFVPLRDEKGRLPDNADEAETAIRGAMGDEDLISNI
ncbi:hypothetical protein AURDEDRAFT_188259 [Auricularia subglabra TFB-10046 SS5]|nr:hypothetical protein AURDEDRAFT_188259 [Auricularia subglabra TFB-10046 SS5]